MRLSEAYVYDRVCDWLGRTFVDREGRAWTLTSGTWCGDGTLMLRFRMPVTPEGKEGELKKLYLRDFVKSINKGLLVPE